MNKDWKYLIYLGVLATLLVSVFLGKDKQYDWTVTLSPEDKNPYGTYVLSELLPSILANQRIGHNNQTFYEFKDSARNNENIFLLCESFNPDQEDVKAMLKHVAGGGVVFVSANYIYGKFADTLGIRTKDYFFDGVNTYDDSSDTSIIHLTNPRFDTTLLFYYKRGNAHSYITQGDTSVKKRIKLNPTVVSCNDKGNPTTIKIPFGKGQFIVNSTPLIFSNIYFLDKNNHQLISSLLSYFPENKTFWSEYYQSGRMEASSPLRYILTTEPLRWAYYISIIAVIFFIVFEAKRKQRIIPVIKPLANTSLEFVSTIGTLYYESSDHKSIALKKILYFQEALRTKFNFSGSMHMPNLAQHLSHKTGVSEEIVNQLVGCINSIMSKEKITAEELTELNRLINQFWNK